MLYLRSIWSALTKREPMDKVLLMRNKLQIAKTIVGLVQVFVVYFQTRGNWAVKRFPNDAMNQFTSVFAFTTKMDSKVARVYLRKLHRALCFIASPCAAFFDRKHSGYASTQVVRNVFQLSAVCKSTFSFLNLFGGKQFSSRNTAYVSKTTGFVQTFKAKHGRPKFHVNLHQMCSYNKTELVGVQT